MPLLRRYAAVVALAAHAFAVPLFAQEGAAVDGVMLKDGKPYAIKGGEKEIVLRPVSLPGGITVAQDGKFKVGANGKERPLKEGQLLSKDGRLMSPDGKLEVVFDHVTMDRGQLTVTREGERSSLSAELKLADGARVAPDGWVTSSGGRRSCLLDGQILLLDGGGFSAQDTVTLRDGKVIVQKDGAQFELAKGRTLAMSDGSKVYGDGYVLLKNGKREQLIEGQIITIEGAVTRR